MGGISPEYYSIGHYCVEKGMVNHNNSICIYVGLNRSNLIVFPLNTILFLKNKYSYMFLLVKAAIRKIQR